MNIELIQFYFVCTCFQKAVSMKNMCRGVNVGHTFPCAYFHGFYRHFLIYVIIDIEG